MMHRRPHLEHDDFPGDGTARHDEGGALMRLASSTTGGLVTTPHASGTDGSSGNVATWDETLPRLLWRRRVWVAGVGTACLLLGVLYVLLTPKTHTAVARLRVEPAGGALIGAGDRSGSTDPREYLHTQARTLHSGPILALALGAPGASQMRLFEGETNRVRLLKRELRVDPIERTSVLEVALSARDPDEAVRMVDAVVEAYVAQQSTRRRGAATEMYAVLRSERDKAKRELAERASAMAGARRDAGVAGLGGVAIGSGETANAGELVAFAGGSMAGRRLAALGDALTRAQIETVTAKSVYDEALLSGGLSDQQVTRYPGVAISAANDELVRNDLFTLQQQLVDLHERLLPNHPTVRRLEERLGQLRIAQASANRQRWLGALRRESDLQHQFDRQQESVAALDRYAADYARSAAEVKRLETNLDRLDAQMRDLAVAENAGALNIEIIEPASTDDVPPSPRAGRTLAISLIGGLLLGCLAAVVRDWADPAVTGQEAGETLGLAVLGNVPDARTPGAATPSPERLAWASHLEPHSPAARAYRDLLVTLRLLGGTGGEADPLTSDGDTRGVFGQGWRSMLITSPDGREGVTTVAVNLAIVASRVTHSTLLIDLHATRPGVARTFDTDNTGGLAGVLDGSLSVERAVRTTALTNLHVLPVGTLDPTSLQTLLNGPRFETLLHELCNRYERVLLDAPPVRDASGGEATQIVAGACDVTLLVLRHGRTDRRAAVAARDTLLNVAANLVGGAVVGTPSRAETPGRSHTPSPSSAVRANAPYPVRPEGLASMTGAGTPVVPLDVRGVTREVSVEVNA